MHRACRSIIFAAMAAAHCLAACAVWGQTGQTVGGVQAEGSPYRLIRSVSGSKGSQQGGKYVMEDPRSVFYVPDDHQVIVYFEWEGPAGSHHLEGFWKGPNGKVSVLSDFQYEAKQRRFGAFWTLAISETAATGTWTFEAHIDGEAAGSDTFQILPAGRPANVIPTRRILKPSEIYQRAVSSTVTVEKLDSKGERLGQASGFAIQPGLLVTAFEAIDGATRIRILFPDGGRVETD